MAIKTKGQLNWRWEVIQAKMVAVIERYEELRRETKK